MASIRRRGDKYEVRIVRKGTPAQCKSFPALQDAQAWARRIEREIDRGVALGVAKVDKVLLSELVARYRKDIAPSHKGFAQEGLRLAKWAEHALARREAQSIRPADLAAWRDKRLQSVGPSTVRNELAILSSVFEAARLDWGYTFDNPCKGIRRPSSPEGRTRRMGSDEVQRILACTDSAALKKLLPLALATACRRGELLRSTWRDVSLKNRTLKLLDCKNGSSRTVALSPAALAILERLPRRLDGGLIFDQTPHSITVAFRRAVARARAAYEAECAAQCVQVEPDYLTGLRLHDARHEAASALFEKGLSIPEVASMTGHKDWRMLKRYTHVKADALALKLKALA